MKHITIIDKDIPGYDTFVKIEPIDKGWSSDKKYYIETMYGERLLIRVSDISQYEYKKKEYKMIKRISELGVHMQHPIDFGICDDGKSVYTLLTWVDGKDAEEILPYLTETEQYVLGLKAGEMLRQIHSISESDTVVNFDIEEWETRFNRKTDRKIDSYHKCKEQGLITGGEEHFISYVENNRHLLKNRPQCHQHGDYHLGNMVIAPDNSLYIIDWNRNDFGDPWEEFNRITFTAHISPHFATGQLCGYFDSEPPEIFFKLLAFYISSNQLGAISWAMPFGESEIEFSKKQNEEVLCWYDNMRSFVPSWYLKDFYIQYIDGVPYKLKKPFDLSFMNKYGTVFKVFDDQDSGNICFGVRNGDERYFIKFAGAPTERTSVSTREAIANLKRTEQIYRDLSHPNLIKFITAEDIGGGFVMVFQWVDAECMHPMYPLSRRKFMKMSNETKCKLFNDILDFHAHVIEKGYVPIDFYDGSIMYDFNNDKTIICDIDFFEKIPYINNQGRMWGSSRFMSPEEFTLGAVIDEITTIYTMGATAFALFGNERDRCIDKWILSESLFEIAKKAVSNERNERQQSIVQLIEEWRAAE